MSIKKKQLLIDLIIVIFFLSLSLGCSNNYQIKNTVKVGIIADSLSLDMSIGSDLMMKKNYSFNEECECFLKIDELKNEKKNSIMRTAFVFVSSNKIDSVSISFVMGATNDKLQNLKFLTTFYPKYVYNKSIKKIEIDTSLFVNLNLSW
jgi:hypothetical protein